MPKHEGLKIKNSTGHMIFIHAPKFRQTWKPVGFITAIPAGYYSQTFQEVNNVGESLSLIEYLTHWGPTKPTPRQFRRMKKQLRKST